ncbi:MAG: hypothetical protein ACI8ZM_002367 [Crocinitomix sp.]|jgi:hypothetical protein
MKIVVLSTFANNDFVDYVASFFEREKLEVTTLGYRPNGISYRESANLCQMDELKGIVKDASLIVIARNENQINAIDSQGYSYQAFNDLMRKKVVLYFDVSELAEPFLNSELSVSNSVLGLDKELISPFFIPNYKETFSKTKGIIDTGLYVKFIRRINAIKTNELAAYFPNDRFTCGIDPTRKFYGEEDGY